MITLYSTHCPRCIILERKLKEKNIEYIEVNDIDEMIRLGLTYAPALKIDDKMMEFNEAIQWANAQ